MTGIRGGFAAACAGVAIMWAAQSAAGVTVRWEDRIEAYPGSAYAVAVDPAGNAYAGGTMREGGMSGTSAALLRRFSSTGNRVWSLSQSGGGATWFEDAFRSVAIYPVSATAWDIIAAGVIWNPVTSSQDAFVVRCTALGAVVWTSLVDPSGGGSDGINGVAVTPAGDILVTGWMAGTGGFGDIWVARLNGNSGAKADDTSVTDLLGVDDAGLSIAVDASGSVYVGGYATTAGESANAWLAKFESPAAGNLGLPLWTLTLNGAGSATDFIHGVAVDNGARAVYAVGAETGPSGWLDILVARATFDGGLVWTRTLDGGEQDNDEADACAVAAGGDLLVTGNIDPPTDTFSDIWVARFASNGSLQWSFDHDGPAHYVDGGRGVALDASGGIRIAGVETDAQAVPRFYVVSLLEVQGPAGGGEAGPSTPHATPNPFRPRSGGAFDAPAISLRAVPPGATVRIYTLVGEQVVELKDSDHDGLIVWDAKNAGGKNVSSGVYLFVVDAGSGAVTRGKVVIIR
jgi:hypothetical protein